MRRETASYIVVWQVGIEYGGGTCPFPHFRTKAHYFQTAADCSSHHQRIIWMILVHYLVDWCFVFLLPTNHISDNSTEMEKMVQHIARWFNIEEEAEAWKRRLNQDSLPQIGLVWMVKPTPIWLAVLKSPFSFSFIEIRWQLLE